LLQLFAMQQYLHCLRMVLTGLPDINFVTTT